MLGAATHDDGAVCGAAVQPVPRDRETYSQFRSDVLLMSQLMMIIRVYVKMGGEKRTMLPLYAQCQDDAVVTLEGFLTFVGGACVPHLKGNGRWIVEEFRLWSRKNIPPKLIDIK